MDYGANAILAGQTLAMTPTGPATTNEAGKRPMVFGAKSKVQKIFSNLFFICVKTEKRFLTVKGYCTVYINKVRNSFVCCQNWIFTCDVKFHTVLEISSNDTSGCLMEKPAVVFPHNF